MSDISPQSTISHVLILSDNMTKLGGHGWRRALTHFSVQLVYFDKLGLSLSNSEKRLVLNYLDELSNFFVLSLSIIKA